MNLIETKSLKKDYLLGKTVVQALKGIDIKIDEGDFTCIIGPSGCGKSTLLNIIGLIDEATSGQVFFQGDDVTGFSDNKESDVRLKRIGFIFQAFNLVGVLNVLENIEFPLMIAGVNSKTRRNKALSIASAVGLSDFLDHKPDQLSGGQRQRVAIARALVSEPKLVIADEPTANLDSVNGTVILELMKKLNEEIGTAFIFSSHNSDVLQYAKRVIRLKDGLVHPDRESA